MADAMNDAGLIEGDISPSTTAPWHFWAIAAVALLWNSFGAWDYTSYQLGLAQVDPAMEAKLQAAPIWATAAWALGVWASFAGSILLLLRSRHAVTAFIVSLVAAVISFAWQYSAGLVATPVLPVVILAAVALLWWYTARMRGEGVLR